MCQGGVLEVSEDLFDDGVFAMLRLGGHQRLGAVSEAGVIPPGGKQLALPTGRLSGLDTAHDQPVGHRRGAVVAGEAV